MNSKRKLFLAWLSASLLMGLLTQPLIEPSRRESTTNESLATLESGLGQGITLAALGGYKTIAANFVWISMYGDWQYRRKPEVLEKMQLAVSLNPESLYFWIDGSRIIANDMPVWQVGLDFMQRLFEDEQGIAVRKRYAEQALAFLAQAPDRVATQVPILVEKGAIAWQRLDDLDAAIPYFEQAVARPDAPYYVSRVYAELLVKNGQKRKALEYLRSHYDKLPDDARTAMKPMVARRIAQLETALAGEEG